MKKVLISWIATRHDFYERSENGELLKADGVINLNGPHVNLYKYFPEFDEHYLLSSKADNDPNEPIEWAYLQNYLKTEFGKKVYLERMNIKDITSVGLVKGVVHDFIEQKLFDCSVEIFVNPGTPAMQTAWYLNGMDYSRKDKSISFFKIKEARFTDSDVPEKEYLRFENSAYATATNIREIEHIQKGQKKYTKPFVTKSFEPVYKKAQLLAGNNATTVLIKGDTGTGKEILAGYIHYNSNRKRRSYITINCASFQGDLLESRLFGFKKGAFTGALENTKGAFEQANGGTIFLDEIGDITPRMQISLLRVLQEKRIAPIGTSKDFKVDVRIITASNKNLWQLCKEGKFRYDLYYRLAIAELELPKFGDLPFNERKEWIEFLNTKKRTFYEKRKLTFSNEVWNSLLHHPFPGNIRELENVMDHFYTFCNDTVTSEDLPDRLKENFDADFSFKLEDAKFRHIVKVYDFCGQNVSKASKLLDISRTTVVNMIKKNKKSSNEY